jgi:hypothetical protein
MARSKSHLRSGEDSALDVVSFDDSNNLHSFVERYLSDREIADRNGISEATKARWCREGKYPKPIKLVPNGPNRTLLSVILAHEASRAAASSSEPPISTSFTSDSPFAGYGPHNRRDEPAPAPKPALRRPARSTA